MSGLVRAGAPGGRPPGGPLPPQRASAGARGRGHGRHAAGHRVPGGDDAGGLARSSRRRAPHLGGGGAGRAAAATAGAHRGLRPGAARAGSVVRLALAGP
ncbi:hypothetical protein G5V59_24840 [Nocardioides sp. W3-2-3]|uniref:hypothetical protein n=1 Tax=Nocardioides convexus TaxID=2712224 RepID=UPI002418B9F4|nr:hypothetical protein [Nocardioides convexus]NHA01814.1 hypothetical protein [Nocardioides convexus]